MGWNLTSIFQDARTCRSFQPRMGWNLNSPG
jgi:hypothetical protein